MEEKRIMGIPVGFIDPDPSQPRKTFRPEGLERLTKTFKLAGIVQPITVRPHPVDEGRYMLVAGERRWRAAKLAGLEEVPCIFQPLASESRIAQLAENFGREDLNPLEAADSFEAAHEELGLTWDELADTAGIDVQTIHLKRQLLALPEPIKQMIRDGKLTQGAALNLKQFQGDTARQMQFAMDIIAGRNPLEMEGALHEKARRQRKYSGSLTSPEGLLRRILQIAWRAPSMKSALHQFNNCSIEAQMQAWGSLTEPTRRNVATQIGSLNEAFSSFLQLLANLGQEVLTQPVVESQQQSLPKKPPIKAAASPTSPRPPAQTPIPPAQPQSRPPSREQLPPARPPAPPPAAASRSGLVVQTPSSDRLVIYRKPEVEPAPKPLPPLACESHVFADALAVFNYCAATLGARRSKLGCKDIGTSLPRHNGHAGNPEQRIQMAFRLIANCWRKPLGRSDTNESNLISTITSFRTQANVSLFTQFSAMIKTYDRSPDPLDFSRIS